MRYDQQYQNYGGYGYGGYPQSPQQQSYYNMQPQQPQPMFNEGVKTFFVNGIEGVKTFIIMPNQTVYLRDADSNKFYEKRADNMGRCEIKCYELTEFNENNQNTAPKQTKPAVTKEDIDELEAKINTALENLMKVIKGEPKENE